MNETLEMMVDSLKQEPCYQEYLLAREELAAYSTLLHDYQRAKEEYIKMKPYFKYQDFSELKKTVTTLAAKVTKLEAYQRYKRAEDALQVRLDTLNELVFRDVFLTEDKNDASHCREV